MQRLGIWIAESTPGLRHPKEWVSAPVRSVRDGRRLQVRLVETRLERILLLDEDAIELFKLDGDPLALCVLGVTEREAEVLYWVTEGKGNAEVAAILQIALRTVKKHLEHIFAKLGVENRTCAAARAGEVLRRGSAGSRVSEEVPAPDMAATREPLFA